MKNIFWFLVLLFMPFGLTATDCIPDCECETDWTLEVRGAYYHPTSTPLRKVYTSHWLDYQVEAAKRVHPYCEIWGGVSWASKEGRTTRACGYDEFQFKDKTKIFVLPLSAGLKFIYPILPCIDVYVGGGICYSFLRIKNRCQEHYSYFEFCRSPFKKAIFKNEVGGVIKLGVQYAMSDSTFLDFFADYLIQRFHFSHHVHESGRRIFKHHLDCSGFKFGIGLGVYF
jgi:outer membrane protein